VSVSVLAAAQALREALAGFEPGLYSGVDCARLADELAATEKACAGARLLAGARAVAAGVHREKGFKDGPSWLAQQCGTTSSQARQALETARRLEDCTDTRTALLGGHISVAAASEITQSEADTPGAEAALLPSAGTVDLSRLREQARQHLQAHTPVADLHHRQQQARYFRHWKDRLGMVCFAGALPPETGLAFIRRIELAAQRARRNSGHRPDTDTPSFEMSAADALVALAAADTGTRRSTNTELVIVCDLFAWRRGHTHPGEVCHLIDGGPLPVELAHELAHDAFVSAVLHDGVAIHTVRRFGRYLPAELRTALDLGPVPAFTGRQCVDCGQRWRLHYDHVDPVANHGPTSYDNIQARCWTDHAIKTQQDRKAGLLGPHPVPGPPPIRQATRGP
jgi:hypothetical protein